MSLFHIAVGDIVRVENDYTPDYTAFVDAEVVDPPGDDWVPSHPGEEPTSLFYEVTIAVDDTGLLDLRRRWKAVVRRDQCRLATLRELDELTPDDPDDVVTEEMELAAPVWSDWSDYPGDDRDMLVAEIKSQLDESCD